METYKVNANKKIDIKSLSISNLTMIILGLYLYLETLCSHSIYSQIMMVVVVLACCLNTIYAVDGKTLFTLKFNPLIACYGLFIIYQVILFAFGVAQNRQATLNDIITMVYSFIVVLFVYSFLYKKVDLIKFEIMFVIVGIISVITVMILCRDSLGTGRMAHVYKEGISYYFLGVPVSISSNSLASIWAISVYFCCKLVKCSKKVLYKIILLFSIILLTVGIALSGSRKGFLFLILCIAGYYFINSNKNVIIKVIIAFIICVCLYQLVLRVPVLYNTLGERLEVLVNNILGLSDIQEGSMTARERYAKYAIEAFNNNKLFGYGSGWFRSQYDNVTENDYYETLVSGGIIGFIIYYSFVLCAVYSFIKIKNKNKEINTYFFLLIIILITMWGSVIVLSRNYLIYLTLYFLCADKKCNRTSN